MNDWKERVLGEISLYINRGFSPKYVEEDGVPIINQRCIRNGKIDYGLSRLTSTEKRITTEKILIKEDILINSTGVGTAGRVAMFKEELRATADTHVSIVRIDSNKAYAQFVFQNLRGRENEIEGIAEGSTGQIELGRQRLNQLDLILPPLPEQKAIAEVLSSLDDKIDLLHRQNQTLEAMAETLFRQWFVEEANESWEEKSLKELVKIGIGRTPPRKEFHWFSTTQDVDNKKWISIKDLGDSGIYVFKTSEYLTKDAVETFRIPIIPKNTVVLSFKMTLGRVGITTEDMLSNEAIAHFRFTDETPFTKEYLYFYLKTFPYQSLGSTSSIVTSINSGMIKDLVVTIPPKEVLKQFEELTSTYFDKIESNQKQIQTLENLRETLLPKLMSGEIRVNS